MDDKGQQPSLEEQVALFQERFYRVEREVGRVIVGMKDIVRHTLIAISAGGHVLLEGVPGLGKTLLVKSLSRTFGLPFKRIQFTPDLMPSDITGTQILSEDEQGHRRFVFKPGPIFANIVLADEVNRATPKTQAALLEAMEERQITVLDQTYRLNQPFFVLATQNPVELEGTYPLPEAQLDRFIFKLLLVSPSSADLKEILTRTTGAQVPESRCVFAQNEVTTALADMRALARRVVMPDSLQDVLVRLLSALTPGGDFATDLVDQYVRFGPGPRGAQSVVLCAKVTALLDNRLNLSFDDIKSVLLPALRHRMILNFQADADGVSADDILNEVKNAK